ncbi:MAG: hypothetical protein GXO08_04520 [Aquificae bacterium]|nr:hypothetical protein [Aquificota bacterium]
MVLTSYVFSHFARTVALLSLFLGLFVLAGQFFSTLYLLFALPPLLAAGYLFMLFSYTFLVAMGLSLPLAVANLVYTFKEKRAFHVLYTFGVSEKKVLKVLWAAVLLLSLAGAAASYAVNYQKISHLTKYLKFKFGEKVLLTVPERSFATFDGLTVYFEDRRGNRFQNILLQVGGDLAVARGARLLPYGLLELQNGHLFARQGDYWLLSEGRVYTLNLVGRYSYEPPQKKFLKETAFSAALFLSSAASLPLLFYAVLRRAESRFKALLWGAFFTLLQFVLAVFLKALV